jgi:hypothetical protein
MKSFAGGRMFNRLDFSLPDGGAIRLELRRVLAAGYTGRDRALVQAHIDELAAQGIAPPPQVPILFPVMPSLVTTADEIAVLGAACTPEIEVALFRADGIDYVSVASDHTDREAEQRSITLAKNLCPKPVSGTAWPVAPILDHWDDLGLSLVCDGVVIQQGTLAMIMPHDELLTFTARHDGDDHEGRLVLSGTVPTLNEPPRGEARFEMMLDDPELGRRLEHAYTVRPMSELFE